MSAQLFEVAFSGQISEGADLDDVKARVGKMFNADDAKLAQLFSGKRIIIKKNIDQATATKYLTALNRAGAECEILPMGGGATEAAAGPEAATPEKPAQAEPSTPAAAAASAAVSQDYETSYDGEVAPPPQTDPLGITGDQIEDLAVSMAPIGSELQDDYSEPEAPAIDITGIDIAPVGSDLTTTDKKPEPPPPDTSGITLAD